MSLTSVICKLLERLIKDHLVDFLVKNKLINPSQHGFLNDICIYDFIITILLVEVECWQFILASQKSTISF